MSSRPTIETEDDLRIAFWDAHPELAAQAREQLDGHPLDTPQNGHNATTRTAWGEYVDRMARDGVISDELARTVTL